MSNSNYIAQRWEDARQICRESFSDDENRYLDEIKDCDEFQISLTAVSAHLDRDEQSKLLYQLKNTLRSLENFVALLAVTIGRTPLDACLIWGLLSLLIQAAARMPTVLTETIDMLNNLGHDLEVLQILERSFADNPTMRDDLIAIFVDIITFWVKIIHFLRRNQQETSIKLYWSAVQKDWEATSKKIRTRSSQIKEKADALAATSMQPAALLEKIERLNELLISQRPGTEDTQQSIFPCHNIPYLQNSHFKQRDAEIREISLHLAHDETAPSFKSFAIWGPGGVGKTQVALEYCYQELGRQIDLIMWIDCETGLSTSKSFSSLAKMLQLNGAENDTDPDNARHLILDWLRKTNISWLMVLDNIEDTKLAWDCWPHAPHGSILVTSRTVINVNDPTAAGMEIKTFNTAKGGSILLHLVNRYPYSDDEKHAAEELSHELGGLGLALTVMAAQIISRQKSIRAFLKFYQQHALQLHRETRGLGMSYKASLRTCWISTFESLGPESTTLLSIIAFIAPIETSEELFQPSDTSDMEERLLLCADEFTYDNAMQELLSASLVHRAAGANSISIHRLIQREFRNFMSIDQLYSSFLDSATLLHKAFPKQINGNSLRNESVQCKKYIEHALFLCRQWQTYKFKPRTPGDFLTFTRLMTNCGWHLLEEGMWSEEIELMQTALHVCEDKSGLEYAHLCNTYGHLEVERANASKGLEYLETSRKIRETLLDPMHPELANTYNNIGNAVLQEYETPEAVPRAIELYSRSVKINDAPSSAFIWHLNLSRATRLAGDYARARFHAAKSRECVDEMFEPDTHWDATTKVHLANILFDEGLIPEAEALWTSAFKAFQKTSETRAATVAVQLKLAHVTMLKGDHKQAVIMLERLLTIAQLRLPLLGNNGEIARVTRRLAQAVRLCGDTVKAEQLRERAERMRLEIQKGRKYQLPDEDQSYNILVFSEFW